MKKSYHSIEVPTRVLASTFRSSAGMRPVRSASVVVVDMRTPLFSRGLRGQLLNDWSVRKSENIAWRGSVEAVCDERATQCDERRPAARSRGRGQRGRRAEIELAG